MAEDIRQVAAAAICNCHEGSFSVMTDAAGKVTTRSESYGPCQLHRALADVVLAAVRPVLLAEGYRACQADAERAIEAATAHSSIRWPVALALTAVRSLAPATQPETPQ